ncbi:sulfurtransferase [Algicella marina]|uniref:Sulfurtransferase n=1 Tax=Algicella marina TaxID=2683284 RepID=A0A6P1SZ47_9RHOB|nr:rhodanese-like domain-containing protein [Algicella marina]QHQ35017.1 sulfurtransferase [Algicella marina]
MPRLFTTVIAGLLALPTGAFALSPLTSANEALPQDALIIDIRAPEDFAAGHIPGAVNAPYGKFRGPAENPGRVPDAASLEETLESIGAETDKSVIVVHEGKNATDFGAAARVYWTLKSVGFSDLSVLNGGYTAWAETGAAPETGAVTPEVSDIDLTFSDDWMMTTQGVEDVVAGTSEAVLLDARPLDFFEGRQKHDAAEKAGTLSGALNFVHSAWFPGDSPVIEPSETKLTEIRDIAAAEGDKPLVSFCNTGHWAATNWFVASELAGIDNVKLYPESMVGWTLLDKAVTNGG